MWWRFSAGLRVPYPPLWKLQLENLFADQPFDRGNAGFVALEQVGRDRVLIETASLTLLDPDPDQVAREVVAFG